MNISRLSSPMALGDKVEPKETKITPWWITSGDHCRGDSSHVYDGEEYEYDCNWNEEDNYIYDAGVDDDYGLNLRAFVKQLLEIIWQRWGISEMETSNLICYNH